MNHFPPQDRVNAWPLFATLVVALTMLLVAVFALHIYLEYRAESARHNSNEMLNVELARVALGEDIATVSTDLLLLTGLLRDIDFSAGQPGQSSDHMASLFLTFAQRKALYDQVRFLDLHGMERVRVNWNDGRPSRVDGTLLQDKSKRYYVSQAMEMKQGQVYLSPFDLNVEAGRIETPLKPVLRFVSPVFDRDGQRRGLLVINYLGERLLQRFRQIAANIADHVYLLNADAYWLSHPRAEMAWGFMYGRQETFASDYPDVWRQISAWRSGQLEHRQGLFTFATVSPLREASRHLDVTLLQDNPRQRWKVVAHRESDALMAVAGDLLRRYAVLYLGVLALLVPLSWLVATAQAQRRRAEAHRAYERKFRSTLEEIGLLALMVDAEGNITFANHFLLELSGWDSDDIVGANWFERFVPDNERGEARRQLQNGPPEAAATHEYEGEILIRGGEKRLIAWHYTFIRDGEGEISGLTAIGEDITEKRVAAEQLRKLSRAVEQSPASVVITTREGLIEYVNPKFSQVTGYSLDEVRGRNPSILKSGETPDTEYSALWQALSAGGEWRGEFHNRRKDGTLYWEAAVISALRDQQGEITHFLAVKEDISERKRLQQEVDARNLELARAQALMAMGRMASMLAHDLSNPLSSVKMAMQILTRQASGGDALELASIGLEQIGYMEHIISDMLTYARPGELQSSWLDVEKLLNAAVGTTQKRILEHGVQVDIECEAGLPTFPGDTAKLRQLLSNLIVNAVQASVQRPQAGRRLSLRAQLEMLPAGRHMRIEVCDQGEGIDEDVAARLFEPFFTTRSKGTGLGLAIVRQIVDLHGGDIEFKANEPCGTCAVLWLPMTPVVTTRRKAEVVMEQQREIA